MTLDTRVYVLDPIDRETVFRKCQEIIAQWDDHGRAPGEQRWKNADWGRSHVLMNEGWQGLPGWLIVRYRPESPYRTEEEAAEHDGCDPDCDGSNHPPACWLEVSIDTAYGYKGSDGMNCGSLHARFVAKLGVWLDAEEVRWRWLNEYTGEVREGYDKLPALVGSSDQATAWFEREVKPAIARLERGAK